MLQRLEHVAVAQVPGLGRPVIHDAVIALRRSDEPRVLGGVEEAFAVLLPILTPIFHLLLEQITQHRDHGGFALA